MSMKRKIILLLFCLLRFYITMIRIFFRVIACSVCANEANINLNVTYYALDASVFEVLSNMSRKGKRDEAEEECGWRMSRG